MKGSTRKLLWTGLSILFLATLALFLSYQPKPQPPLTTVKIAVSTTPLSAPFYVAQERGYFEDAGISVSMLEIPGGARCFKKMIDGTVDLATSSDSVIMFNSFLHKDFSVLASFVESDNDIKLLTLNQQLNSAKDLSGLKIGVTQGSASEYFLHSLAATSGVQANNFETVHFSADQMPEALLRGDVDAISVWEPFAYKTIQMEKTTKVIQSKGLYNLSFNLVGKTNTDAAAQETRKRVLIALNRAVHYISSYPQQTQQILKQRLQLQQPFIDWIWQDYLFKISLNNALISTLESQARWAIETEMLPYKEIPEFRALLDADLLRQVEPGLSTL